MDSKELKDIAHNILVRRYTEHAIGERFEIDHIIYEVRPAHSCQGCSLYIEDENECLDRHRRFGHCDGNNRTDGQDVKFVQVGEVNIDK